MRRIIKAFHRFMDWLLKPVDIDDDERNWP